MLVVLGIMVLVHELGHFIVAKLCGVRVEVFSIGFGKRLFGFRRGDTDYRLSLLPLGGYVKMAGESFGDGSTSIDKENPDATTRTEQDPGDFTAHPRWQRILIGLAGPVANFIFAFALMSGFFMMHNEVYDYQTQPPKIDSVPANTAAATAGIKAGDTIVKFDSVDHPTWEQIHIHSAINLNHTVPLTLSRDGELVSTQLKIEDLGKGDDFDTADLGLLPQVQTGPVEIDPNPAALESGMPAERAGLKPGDLLISVDGRQYHSVSSVLNHLQEVGGHPVHLSVQRGGQTIPFTLTPVLAPNGSGHDVYRLGFKQKEPPYHVEQLPLVPAVKKAVDFNVKNSGLILEVLQRMVTRRLAVQQLSGPIGIARQTGLAVSMNSWQPIITLMAEISLNLGIFNLLPIPILDGGMILLLLIEGLIRRDINHEFKERIYQVAFVVLVLFAVFVMFNDVSKLNIFSKFKP